jgi:hypothetical protein
MKRWLSLPLVIALFTTGCAPTTQQASAPTQPAQPQPVKLTAEQELTKYCRDDCKKKFDANSKRYALK